MWYWGKYEKRKGGRITTPQHLIIIIWGKSEITTNGGEN